MEHRTLYRNEDVSLSALAVLPVERAVTSSSAVLQTSFGDDSLRLNAGEELRILLFCGTTDGGVLSLRCTLKVRAGSSAPENCVVVEGGCRRQQLTRTAAPAGASSPRSPSPHPCGRAVTFLWTSRELPLLLALSGGRLECLRCADLQPMGNAFFKRLQLPRDAVVTRCCAAKDPRASASPLSGGEGGEDPTALPPHRCQRLALVSAPLVFLVECSSRGALHMRRMDAVATPSSSSSSSAAAVLTVPGNAGGEVLALDWQGDTLLLATRSAYVVYNTVTCLSLQQVDLSEGSPRQPLSASRGFSPLLHYLSAGWAGPGCTPGYEEGWALAAEFAAPVAEEELGDTGDGERRRDDALAWPASLLFSTPDGELRLLNALADGGDGSQVDLRTAEPLRRTGVHGATDAFAASPFLVLYRADRERRGGEFVLQSCLHEGVWAAPAAPPERAEGKGRGEGRPGGAPPPVGSPHAVVRVRAEVGVLCGLVATPVGVFGFTEHSIEAVLLRPAAALAGELVAAGRYETAVRYVLSGVKDLLPRSRRDDGEGGPGAVGADSSGAREEELRRLCHDCAMHALSSARYEEAFRFLVRAGTPAVALLRLFPELWVPSSPRPASLPVPALTLSYPHAEAPYRAVFECLFRSFDVPGEGEVERQEEEEGREGPKEGPDERAAVEYALFLLYALGHGNADAVTRFFTRAKRLPLDWCLAYVGGGEGGEGCTAKASAPPPPYPRPDLLALLLAAAGRFPEALSVCERAGDVKTAAAVLRMTLSSSLLDELCEAHLPWMLRRDAAVALAAVLPSVERRRGRRALSCRPSPDAVVPILAGRGGGEALHTYLASEIYDCGSLDRRLHTLYALNMVDTVALLTKAGLRPSFFSAATGVPPPPAGSEGGVLGATRRALLQYLDDDAVAVYEEERVLAQLQQAALHEEQVVVLHRMGDHAGALRVLAYDLCDVEGAVQYCLHQHALDEADADCAAPPTADASPTRVSPCLADAGSALDLPTRECLAAVDREVRWLERRIGGAQCSSETQWSPRRPRELCPPPHEAGERFNRYLPLLLQLLWVPPVGKEPQVDAALRLLNVYARYVDPMEILELLPGDTPLSLLSSYLVRSFQAEEFNVGLCEAEAAAACSVFADAESFCAMLQQRCVAVDGQRLCAVCLQPVREKEPIAVFPNLKVTHFRCFQDGGLDPERGVAYRNIL